MEGMQTGKRSRPGKVVSSNYGLPVKISNVAINRLERVRVSFGSIDRRSKEGKWVRESTSTIVNERPRIIKAAAAIFRHGESPRAGVTRESAPRDRRRLAQCRILSAKRGVSKMRGSWTWTWTWTRTWTWTGLKVRRLVPTPQNPVPHPRLGPRRSPGPRPSPRAKMGILMQERNFRKMRHWASRRQKQCAGKSQS